MGCYIWYSDKGPRAGPQPAQALLAVPNVTAHPSTASVPITVLLYDGPLLCGFNVAIKGLKACINVFTRLNSFPVTVLLGTGLCCETQSRKWRGGLYAVMLYICLSVRSSVAFEIC